MTLNDALQEALKGKMIGRRHWPISKVVSLDISISIGVGVICGGEAIHPLLEGKPLYAPIPEDCTASDWIACD